MNYIHPFSTLRLTDIPAVGGKNASLGELIFALGADKDLIPQGFALDVACYWRFLKENNLHEIIDQAMATLTTYHDREQLALVGRTIRHAISQGKMPQELIDLITKAYKELCAHYQTKECDVAVRSSATAEDLPSASFAGQQESFLHIHGIQSLLTAIINCFASLFTDRAIAYRLEKGFDYRSVGLSVGVQKMVRSDLGCSGVAFSLDPDTGFREVIVISSSYGLGEAIVQGKVTPDEFIIHKPTLAQGYPAIIQKKLGDKTIKMVYLSSSSQGIKQEPVMPQEQEKFSITDHMALELARLVGQIEAHYSALHGKPTPMDIEWAVDGIEKKLYIVQARPETVYSARQTNVVTTYNLMPEQPLKPIVSGYAIGQKIVTGKALLLQSVNDAANIDEQTIIITQMTDPDWVPLMKKAAGIITDQGGRTCHAAIVSRELGIPALVGTGLATTLIKQNQQLTLDCSFLEGAAYDGIIPFAKKEIELNSNQSSIPFMLNLADPSRAFALAALPVQGIGLARIEFIIANDIKIHPMALLKPERIDDQTRRTIAQLSKGYPTAPSFFVEKLAAGIATIASAFYPRPVIVRFSDFKSNEYRNLIGGTFFEPVEENPMIGFRGASRYYHPAYRDAFALEIAAIKKVRTDLGLKNVKVMIPFVRTLHEGRAVLELMAHEGLKSGDDALSIIMMCEVPSNVILIDQFCNLFDGFSIGSNDLTQLTLGVDRDSALLAPLFDERDEAVKLSIAAAIKGAQRNDKPIGICGQAPSDYPEFAQFLRTEGISSISLNADSVIQYLTNEKIAR